MPQTCAVCVAARAVLKRPKTGQPLCRACFFAVFELEIHHTIVDNALFRRGERVAIAASGGKDSTVLAHVLSELNTRYDYGLDLILLAVDEGITGYRDDALATLRATADAYNLPLTVVSYDDLYGWSMDRIVAEVGLKNNCTFCGVFRRQALDRGAVLTRVDQIVTGHNADDIAETVLMNILRGDLPRLRRCTAIKTGGDSAASGGDPQLAQALASIPRSKPFKYTYEKEIVMYAYFKKLNYFSTECTYAPEAYRGFARAFIKDLEARPSAILDIIHSGEYFAEENATAGHVIADTEEEQGCGAVRGKNDASTMSTSRSWTSVTTTTKPAMLCERCGYLSSNKFCKACVLLEGLNRGLPKLGIGKSDKLRRVHRLDSAAGVNNGATCSNSMKQKKTECCGGGNCGMGGDRSTASRDIRDVKDAYHPLTLNKDERGNMVPVKSERVERLKHAMDILES